ncbi:MAG: hypothetical protein ACQERZ_06025, partial [Fusobacteriota bacterium]
SIFELTMLVCFGLAWPVSVYKSMKTKSTEGKSLGFMYIILIGYIAGITHKIIYSFDIVIYVYIINFLMVVLDIFLYYRNQKYEKAKARLKNSF